LNLMKWKTFVLRLFRKFKNETMINGATYREMSHFLLKNQTRLWMDTKLLLLTLIGSGTHLVKQDILELHALASSTKIPIWWKKLDNYIQHLPLHLGQWVLYICFLGVDPWIFLGRPHYFIFQLRSLGFEVWYHVVACSSQLKQKTDILEETRQLYSTDISWSFGIK
jgi:hypothetical protein